MKKILVIISLLFTISCASPQYSSELIELATEFAHNKEYDKALEILDIHLGVYPKDAIAYLLRANICIDLDRYEDAIDNAKSSIRHSKKNGEEISSAYWLCSLANQYLGNYERALDDAERAYQHIYLDDEYHKVLLAEILFSQADLYSILGNYAQSDTIYNRLQGMEVDEARVINGRLENKILRGNYYEALDYVAQLREEGKKCETKEIYEKCAIVYATLGDMHKAIDNILISYGLDNSMPMLSDLVRSITTEDIDYSIAVIQAWLEKDESVRMRVLLSELYRENNEFIKAIEEMDVAEKELGDWAMIKWHRAICLLCLGHLEESIVEHDNAMRYAEDYLQNGILISRAMCYHYMGRFKDAISDYDKYNVEETKRINMYHHRGQCYEYMGEPTLAMQDYNTAMEFNKEDNHALLSRAKLHLKCGNKELADADFESLLQMDTIADPASVRHFALLNVGQVENAIMWINGIVDEWPSHKDALYNKACVYAATNQTRIALKCLQDAIEAGYVNYANIENDYYMEQLRIVPEFKALINKYKSKENYRQK